MRVDELMRDVVAVEPQASLLDAEHVMAYQGLRQLPVARGSTLVGLIDDVTLAASWPSPATTLAVGEVAGHLAAIPVSRLMRHDPLTVAPSTPVAEAARLLKDYELSVLPVVRDDRLVGILVDQDVLSALLR